MFLFAYNYVIQVTYFLKSKLSAKPFTCPRGKSLLENCQPFFETEFLSGHIATNGSQLYAGRDFYHENSYEELNFKYSTFLSYEALNPCLRIGDVIGRFSCQHSSFVLIILGVIQVHPNKLSDLVLCHFCLKCHTRFC